MKYEFKDQNEEEKLNLISFNKAIAQNQIGTFDVYTGNRKLLTDGKGTLFIYFQGIEIKCGIEDRVGNSAISWIEESFFLLFLRCRIKRQNCQLNI